MAVSDLIAADAASPKRIAVIGDAMTDVWVHGHFLPSQDGCRKFVQEKVVSTPGGAANAANCLKHWNADVRLFTQCVRTVKTRFVDSDRIVFRHDKELRGEMYTPGPLRSYHAVLISDYDKGFLTPSSVRYIVDEARTLGIPCVVDAKRDPHLYDGAILKCNDEYATLHPEVLGRPRTVITYGRVSPTCVPGCNIPQLPEVQCLNHVGAGDCFAAHLTLALAHGFDLDEATAVAYSAGRVYVQHRHNSPPLPSEILRDCS